MTMTRRAWGFVAIVIIFLMGLVSLAGLDNLPRQLRTAVASSTAQVAVDGNRVRDARGFVERAIGTEPDLFRQSASSLRARLQQAEARLRDAEAQRQKLQPLAAANRRTDRPQVEQGLTRLNSLRSEATQAAERVRQEVDRRLAWKRDLPRQLAAMRTNYEALQAFNAEGATAPAQKAMADWPAKRDDLQRRVQALGELKTQGERAWEASTDARQLAAAGSFAALDFERLFASAETLNANARLIRERANEVNGLAAQLYTASDKVLLDLDEDNPRQRVRHVVTRYPDVSLANGQVTSAEQWEPINNVRVAYLKDNVGMVVERKPAGRYDSEADRTPQTPGHAYVAPPGQSNQYGSWSNGVWQWLPQYLLLDALLRGRGYPPITTNEYRDYELARRRGEIYRGRYGHTWGRPNGGSSGSGGRVRERRPDFGRYESRPAPRREEPRGWGSRGYGGSRYESRGSYSGSRYQSRGGSSSGGGFGSRSYSRSSSGGRSRGGRR